MQVERIFNKESMLSIEDIMLSIIDEKVDSIIQDYYHNNQVNTSTSHNEGKYAA
ncbi:hypothetical protein [Paenibacillus sp. FSL L8-0499]|uniref:hypothetical protein n=1 Tax=Paenibacillus sp. FSL L8-0499 TaxID=2975334 RepID=UPI0030F88F25